MSAIHKGRRYAKAARIIKLYCDADPNAICWRDGLTMAQHRDLYPDRKLTWTAGHMVKGSDSWWPWFHVTIQPTPGDWLAPEVSTCNIIAENEHRRADPHTERW